MYNLISSNDDVSHINGDNTMKHLVTFTFLTLLIILSSGCTSNNFSKIYYTADMTGTIYTGENFTDYVDSFGERDQWTQPYTTDEWNESTNLNLTAIVMESIPPGYTQINVTLDDKFEDSPNEYYLQYKADIIYPTQRISILYKAWISRK